MSDPPTILLADDDCNDALLLQTAFEAAGICHPVQRVSNGRDAIDYLSGEGVYADRSAYPFPVMLLLDLKMPILDGFAVLQWIREHKTAVSGLAVVVLTGFGLEQAKERACRMGAGSVLAKPFTIDQWNSLALSLKRDWLERNPPPELEL